MRDIISPYQLYARFGAIRKLQQPFELGLYNTVDYIVVRDGDRYKAVNTRTKQVYSSDDASETIQYAINQLENGGKIYVKLNDGVEHEWSKQVNINYGNITLEIYGKFKATQSLSYMIYCNKPNFELKGNAIFDGNSLVTNILGCKYSNNAKIEGITFKGATSDTVVFTNFPHIRIKECIIYAGGNNRALTIFDWYSGSYNYDYSYDIIVENNVLYGALLTPGSKHVNITKNLIYLSGLPRGTDIIALNITSAKDIKITKNTIIGGKQGIYVGTSEDIKINGNDVSSAWKVDDSWGIGIGVTKCYNVIVVGNSSYNNEGTGLNPESANMSIIGNNIHDNGGNGVTIWSLSGFVTENIVLKGNTITDNNGHGVEIGQSGTTTRIFLIGNIIRGNGGWGIVEDAGIDYCAYHDNLVIGNELGQISTVGVNDSIVDNITS